MTANVMSSAPNTNKYEPNSDEYDEEEAATHTEEFLANLLYESNVEDGYVSAGDDIVHITANMVTDDDLWFTSEESELPPQQPPALTTPQYQATLPQNEVRRTEVGPPGLPPISYLDAFQADLSTIAGIDRHESLIYQYGFTPEAIRHDIKLSLRTALPTHPMVAFHIRDIPPAHLDPPTNMVLNALLAERDRPGLATAVRHETNRTMFQVYSDSDFITHDNNFMARCKPHLRNLPQHTALQLQKARQALLQEDSPPYRPIQRDPLPEPTAPTFTMTLAQAQAPIQALRPREQWMRDTPPLVSDADADATYSAACSWMFGTTDPESDGSRSDTSPATLALRSQISSLQG